MKNKREKTKDYTTMIRLNKDTYLMAQELRDKKSINISNLMRNAIREEYEKENKK